MRVRRTIPLNDSGNALASLLPAINYMVGGKDTGPMTIKGIPVSVNVDLAPALHKTVITAAAIIGGSIATVALVSAFKR